MGLGGVALLRLGCLDPSALSARPSSSSPTGALAGCFALLLWLAWPRLLLPAKPGVAALGSSSSPVAAPVQCNKQGQQAKASNKENKSLLLKYVCNCLAKISRVPLQTGSLGMLSQSNKYCFTQAKDPLQVNRRMKLQGAMLIGTVDALVGINGTSRRVSVD